MTAKERHKIRLTEKLGDPNLDFPKRGAYPNMLGISKNTLYKHFSPLELQEIENAAVIIRRESCCRQREQVMNALYKRAIGFSHPDTHIATWNGDVIKTEITKNYPPDRGAGQEFLDRTEGKVRDRVELSGPNGGPVKSEIKIDADITLSEAKSLYDKIVSE